MTRWRRRRRTAATAAVALALTLTACSGDTDDRPEVDGTIIQPGRPGEPAEELDEAPVITPAEANAADVRFAQMMIPHHAQALEMGELAPSAGGSEQIRTLADRIVSAQRPEILTLAGWLDELGERAPTREQIESGDLPMPHDHGGHGGEGEAMTGMATEQQMDALRRARGDDFDVLFLQLMVRHHEGALEMISDVLTEGSDTQLGKLAAGMASDQGSEIDRMNQLLARIG